MAENTITNSNTENNNQNIQNNQSEPSLQHKQAEAQTHLNSAHKSKSEGVTTPSEVFPAVLGHLGDHRELTFFDLKITDLPVIIYDKIQGFHTYSSLESMEKGEVFTTTHGHPPIIRKSDNQPVSLDMSITSLLCFEWIAVIVLLFVFGKVGRSYKKNPTSVPKGLQNAVEALIIYLKEEIIAPNVGSMRATNYLFPYFIALFCFILICNLIGLLPGGHTATGALAVTAALAITAYFVINITAIREAGIGSWLKHLLGGAPIALAPIMIPIEIISMFVKPFALTIRLFANMTAGHVVLLSLVGLIFFFNLSSGLGAGIAIAPISVAFSLFMYALELLVAVLQAYIFTTLTAVFVGLAIGDHAHEHAHEH